MKNAFALVGMALHHMMNGNITARDIMINAALTNQMLNN